MALEFILNHNLVGINSRYFVRNGRNILSSQYRQCKAALVSQFMNFDPMDKPEKPYQVTMESYMYSDIDSCVKIVLDSLEEAGVIDNDRDVLRLNVIKKSIKRGHLQSHFIRVESYKNEVS